VIGPQGINNVTLVRDCKRQNFLPLIITTNFVYSLNQIKQTPEFAGLVGPTPSISPYRSYSVTKDRDAAIKKYAPSYAKGGKNYNSLPLLPLSASWEAAMAFGKAVENANVPAGQDVTAADVIRGLSMFDNETLGGSNPALTYSDGTKPNDQVRCFYLYTIKKNTYVDDLGADKLPKQYCQPKPAP
jgi:hypothetical protein